MNRKSKLLWCLRYEAGRFATRLRHPVATLHAWLTFLAGDKSPTSRNEYHVHFKKDEDWWLAHVQEHNSITQGRTLLEAAVMAEDLIRCIEAGDSEKGEKGCQDPIASTSKSAPS